MSDIAEEVSVELNEQTVQVIDLPPGIPALGTFYLYIADACNLACQHCWITPTYQSNGKGGQFLQLDHVKKMLSEAKPLGLRSVKLTGGEPTLHPQFRELVSMIHAAGVSSFMETNGTLMDESLAEFIHEKGVYFVSVSLDGAKPETHDKLRSILGSFEKAVNGIKALTKAGYDNVQIICTIHRGNLSEIEELVTLASDLGCRSVKFNMLQRTGRGIQFSKKNGLTIPEILDLHAFVTGDLMPRVNPGIHFSLPFAFRAISEFVESSPGHCSIHNILGMLANGSLALCGIGVTIPELIYGNIEKDHLGDIWINHPKLAVLREQIPAQLEGICKNCIHQSFCRGYCVAHNYQCTKKLNAAFNFCTQADELGLFPSSRKKQLSV